MNTTVQIEGVEYAPCEIVQSGDYWGIKTPKMTFWAFPVCDEGGHEIKSLPPFLPREIKGVTTKTPDLTHKHPDTVKRLFEKRRSYFSTATLQTYVSQYPNESWLPCLQSNSPALARGRSLLAENQCHRTTNPSHSHGNAWKEAGERKEMAPKGR
jgi:hypothetical protein